SASALLALNKVSSSADAFIIYTTSGTVSGESVSVNAVDASTMTSTSSVVDQAITTNNIDGVKTYLQQFIPDFDYTAKSGTRSLTQDSTIVYVPVGYTHGGATDSLYRYKGSSGTFDLTTQDYSNSANWTKLQNQDILDALLPDLGNLTDSDARAVGAQVVNNE